MGVVLIFETLVVIFSKHLLRAAHGDLAFLVSSEPLPSPATQLVSAFLCLC